MDTKKHEPNTTFVLRYTFYCLSGGKSSTFYRKPPSWWSDISDAVMRWGDKEIKVCFNYCVSSEVVAQMHLGCNTHKAEIEEHMEEHEDPQRMEGAQGSEEEGMERVQLRHHQTPSRRILVVKLKKHRTSGYHGYMCIECCYLLLA